MKKRFKTKKHIKFSIIFYFIIFIFSLFINYKIINRFDILKPNYEIKIDKENILLNLGLNYKNKLKLNNENNLTVFNENKKRILLYTTHETEEYLDGNIKDAEKYLYDLLIQNYDVILDNTNITKEINDNNLTYRDTYKITRKFLEENIDSNLALAIDLHRDSGVESKYENYAKLMFVIGMKHDSYKLNYQVADSINKMIENNNPNITRGIYTRKSSSYNQDLNGNIILIEIGSNTNSLEEVKNTLDVLYESINLYLGE